MHAVCDGRAAEMWPRIPFGHWNAVLFFYFYFCCCPRSIVGYRTVLVAPDCVPLFSMDPLDFARCPPHSSAVKTLYYTTTNGHTRPKECVHLCVCVCCYQERLKNFLRQENILKNVQEKRESSVDWKGPNQPHVCQYIIVKNIRRGRNLHQCTHRLCTPLEFD